MVYNLYIHSYIIYRIHIWASVYYICTIMFYKGLCLSFLVTPVDIYLFSLFLSLSPTLSLPLSLSQFCSVTYSFSDSFLSMALSTFSLSLSCSVIYSFSVSSLYASITLSLSRYCSVTLSLSLLLFHIHFLCFLCESYKDPTQPISSLFSKFGQTMTKKIFVYIRYFYSFMSVYNIKICY